MRAHVVKSHGGWKAFDVSVVDVFGCHVCDQELVCTVILKCLNVWKVANDRKGTDLNRGGC